MTQGAPVGAGAIAPDGAQPAQTATVGSAAKPQQKPQSSNRPEQVAGLALSQGTLQVANGARWIKAGKLSRYPIELSELIHQEGVVDLAFDGEQFAYLNGVRGALTSEKDGTSWSYTDELVDMTRAIRPSKDGKSLEITSSTKFKGERPKFAFFSVAATGRKEDADAQDQQLLYFSDSSLNRVALSEAVATKEVLTPVQWIGVQNRYFLLALLGDPSAVSKGLVLPASGASAEPSGRVSLVYPVSGDSFVAHLKLYFGPKELQSLRSVDPSLDHAVDLGWFTFVAYPLLRAMQWFYALFGNYGIAIILLTLLVKLVTAPLTYKSMKSMKQMAKLQPQIQKLKEKYGDNKEALNQEMMTLMRTGGYNPAAGCLPILVQMPVFFALYRVLYSSIELYQAPFALWIRDLSAKDPYYVTPIILTGVMYIQQKLTPNTATDPAQAKMMQFMPVIFGLMMVSLPAGLTLYMLVNALASIAQQAWMNRRLGNDGPATARASV